MEIDIFGVKAGKDSAFAFAHLVAVPILLSVAAGSGLWGLGWHFLALAVYYRRRRESAACVRRWYWAAILSIAIWGALGALLYVSLLILAFG